MCDNAVVDVVAVVVSAYESGGVAGRRACDCVQFLKSGGVDMIWILPLQA